MESLFVIAGVVAIVWGAVVFLRGGLLGGCLAVLLAGACFGVKFYKIEMGPVPLTADRALLALLVVQYVLWRRWGLADPKPLGKPEILLLLLLGMLTASTFSSDWTADNYQPVSRLILAYLMPAALYWIARQSKLSERAVLVMFGCFAGFGIYLALTSLAEYFQEWSLVFPRYIATTAASVTDSEFVGRGRGPFLNPIANGVLLATCLGCALVWWPRLRRSGQLMLMATAILMLAAIYCCLTRSVWIGGILVLAMGVGLALPWSWRLPLLGGGLAAAALLAATHWDSLIAFKRDRDLSAEKAAESIELRPILAMVTWQMFLDRPLFGCGYAQYGTESNHYVSDRSTDMPLERARGFIPHNVAFSLLAETGLVGLSLFAAMLIYWARDAWRLWCGEGVPLWARQQGLLLLMALGVYLANGMFHELSVMPMTNMTLFFLAGVTAGLRPMTVALPSSGKEGLS